MKKHSLKLAVLCSAVLASGLISRPALAALPECLAVLASPGSGTWIEITNAGTTGNIYCHSANIEKSESNNTTLFEVEGHPTLCGEAFQVCVGNKFEVGSDPQDDVGGPFSNLNPASSPGKGNESLNQPFIQLGTKFGSKVLFLQPSGETAGGCIVYDLDHQTLDLNNDGDTSDPGEFNSPVPFGTVINFITENRPTNDKCIGVRTTFQHVMGTCKICKVRKYFNTCGSAKTITQVKEFEQVCKDAIMGQLASPNMATLTALAQVNFGGMFGRRQITLTTGNTGANPVNANAKLVQPSAAGSVCDNVRDSMGNVVSGFFFDEFDACKIVTGSDPCRFTSKQVSRPAGSWLEIFLSWFPAGVKLQPYGSKVGGFEKIVTFCIDVQ